LLARNVMSFLAAIAMFACGTSSIAAQDEVTIVDLAKGGMGAPPADFDLQQTGEGERGQWSVVADPTSEHGFAVAHVSTDLHEDRFSLAIYQPIATENAEVTVRFKIVSGTMLSAGLAISVRNPGNYYAVSASALEQSVDLLLIRNGKVERIESSARGDVEVGRWHVLKVRLNDDHFAVSLDDRALFTTYERTRMKDGRIALWTREDNVTRFDQMQIRPLPDTPWR
jgi:hypothetical protein